MSQSTLSRAQGQRGTGPQKSGQRRSRGTVSAMAVIGLWQLRQTWRLLLLIGLSIFMAVVLVCAIPLYVQVAMSAGLRHTLEADPSNLSLNIHTQSSLFSSPQVGVVQDELTQTMQANLGNLVYRNPDFSVQVNPLTVSHYLSMRLVGRDASQTSPHTKLIQGRLPAVSSGDVIELVLLQQGEDYLHLKLNQVFQSGFPVYAGRLDTTPTLLKLNFKFVGIAAPVDTSDVFWHNENLQNSSSFDAGGSEYTRVPALVSNAQLTSVMDHISSTNQALLLQPDIYWYYNFDLGHLDVTHLTD